MSSLYENMARTEDVSQACRKAASEYLALGWSVVPLCNAAHLSVGKAHNKQCSSPGKAPIMPWKALQTDRATEAELQAAWDMGVPLNIGVILGNVSNMIGIDIDGKGGEEVLQRLSKGDLPPTLGFTTPGGGRRLLYRTRPDQIIKTATWPGEEPGSEVKVLSNGTLTVMPPSMHHTGGMYEWTGGVAPSAGLLADAPGWLGTAATTFAGPSFGTNGVQQQEFAKLPVGRRNAKLASIAGAMRRHGAPLEVIEEALQKANQQMMAVPLPEQEVMGIAESIARYDPNPEPKRLSIHDLERGNFNPPPWPMPLSSDASYGLPGEVLKAIMPNTEADEAAVLSQYLVSLGSCIGHGVTVADGDQPQHTNLFLCLVGDTATSRKGTAWRALEPLFGAAEPTWTANCIRSNLASGEAIVHMIRDPTPHDPGVEDKRLLLLEQEFAGLLSTMRRNASTTSAMLRQAFDASRLGTTSKHCSETTSNPHISVIGHTNRNEIERILTDTERMNGFVNRFMWVCVKRSKELALPGKSKLGAVIDRTRDAMRFAKTRPVIGMNAEANEFWSNGLYARLSGGNIGAAGRLLGRGETIVRRLAAIYAVADLSTEVRLPHLLAAAEVWRYCNESARLIFGEGTGDKWRDDATEWLRSNGPTTHNDLVIAIGARGNRAVATLAFKQAVEDGTWVVFRQQTKGRTATIYDLEGNHEPTENQA